MAISFVQYQVSNNTTGGTSSTATFTNPIAAGSVIAVAVVADQGKTFTFSDGLGDTATDSGIGVNNDAGIGTAVQIVAFLSATAGAQTVTVTPTSGWTFLEIAIWEIAGLTVAAWDKTAHTTGISTSPTSTNTPTLSAANEAAIGYGIGNAAYSAAGSGWTPDTLPTSFGDLTQHQITSSTAAIASTGTLSSSVVWHMYCATLMSTGVAPSVAGPGRTTPRIFRPRQGPSRGLWTPRSTFIPASGTTVSGAGASAGVGTASGAGNALIPAQGASAGVATVQAVGRSLASSVAASAGVGAASGVSVVGVTIDAFSSGATNGGWASGSLGRAADLDGFGSPINDSPVTVNQGFGFITIGSGATALLFGVSMASQGHGSNNPGTLTVTLNPSGSNQVMTQLGTLVDQGGTQGGPTYLFGLVNPASGTGNIRIAWTNFTNIQEFYVYAMSFTGTSTASVAAAFYGLNTANDGGTAGATNQVSTSVPVASGDMAFSLHINATNGFRQPADNATGTEMDNDQHITNNSYGQYFTGAGSVITARADNTSPVGTTDFWSASVVAIGTAPAGASVAAASGTGAANGVGAGIANSVGASAGTGTATGVGASTLAGDGVAASIGLATVTGVSAALAASVAASSGVGTATAFTGSLDAGTGASAGVGAAAGIGASLAASVGATAGTGTALGVGDSQLAGQSVGSSAGTSTVLGVGASIWAAIGNASGTAIVVGASPVTELPAGGAGYVMRSHRFTRKRWEELQALIAAERAAAAKAEKVGSPARAEALKEASGKAQDAISALEGVEEQDAYSADVARLTGLLEGATKAKKVADSIREAKEAAVLAEKLQAEADEEYEIMLLLDDGPEAEREMERIVAMMAAMTRGR